MVGEQERGACQTYRSKTTRAKLHLSFPSGFYASVFLALMHAAQHRCEGDISTSLISLI